MLGHAWTMHHDTMERYGKQAANFESWIGVYFSFPESSFATCDIGPTVLRSAEILKDQKRTQESGSLET